MWRRVAFEVVFFVLLGFEFDSPKLSKCATSFDASRDANFFLRNYQSNLLHENLNRQTLSFRDNLAAKSKDFVLCIGIVLVQECQTTAKDFQEFFISSHY